jgi:hypothetical protein
MRELRLPYPDVAELFRRLVFNAAARNQDDHTKNLAFLMSPNGEWRLAPAYDVIWAWNPDGRWTSRHQMSINGKRDAITRDDLLAVAANVGAKKPGAIIDEVRAALAEWPRFAAVAGVAEEQVGAGGGHVSGVRRGVSCAGASFGGASPSCASSTRAVRSSPVAMAAHGRKDPHVADHPHDD